MGEKEPTDEMLDRAADVIEDSPWFDGSWDNARELAQRVLEAILDGG